MPYRVADMLKDEACSFKSLGLNIMGHWCLQEISRLLYVLTRI